VRLREAPAERFASGRAEAARRGAQNWFDCWPLADGTTYLRWADLFEFLISGDGRRIFYHSHEQATLESLNVYLLGQVLSFSLLACGAEPLHGTVVSVKGEAVAFLGDCGSGKSTLGASFLARDFPIVSDDLVALARGRTGWTVSPGIPRLKLFPSVARRLLGVNDGIPMNNGTSKLVLPLGARQSVRRALPLRALYVLSDPRSGEGRPGSARVTIESLSGREAFLEVVRAAFNLLVLKKARLTNQFEFAGRLIAGVPIRRLAYPRKLSLLPVVCDAVLADLAGRK
jgi:hypothetical protein